MLAGKLAAGARAFKSQIGKIDACLIRFAATAEAFAPHSIFVRPFGDPFGRVSEIFS